MSPSAMTIVKFSTKTPQAISIASSGSSLIPAYKSKNVERPIITNPAVTLEIGMLHRNANADDDVERRIIGLKVVTRIRHR